VAERVDALLDGACSRRQLLEDQVDKFSIFLGQMALRDKDVRDGNLFVDHPLVGRLDQLIRLDQVQLNREHRKQEIGVVGHFST
jgi:hypothetical protein